MKHKCGFLKPLTKRFLGNLRTLQKFSKGHHTWYDSVPPSRIFSPKWPFRYRCDSEGERKFLVGRIQSFVYNRRRGRFHLPSRFKELETEISNMSKRDIRNRLLPVSGNDVIDCEFNQSTIEWSGKIMPKTFWRPPRQSLDAMARRVDTHRLSRRDWPRNPKPLWPSFPSISEMVAMSRCGETASGLWRPRISIPDRVTMRDSQQSCKIATRMIRQNFVGIRSTVSVPRQFLPWFRLRHGFLILTVRYDLPIKLVRFLTAQWIKLPFNLWLKVPCRYKHYLQLHDRNAYASELANARSGCAPKPDKI